jgi:hypothetical protein
MMNDTSNLVVVSCRGGCGKEVTTTKRSLYGLDVLHAKYFGYCSDCMPLDENELLDVMGQALVDKLSSCR